MHDPLDRRALLALAGVATMSLAAAPPPAVPKPMRELMIPVAGGRVYVRIDGELHGRLPPLLMIHGGPGGSHYAGVQALPLARDRAIILYDQLDCGRSGGRLDPATWTVPRFLAEIEAIRAALAIPRWHILGHSWGGTLALEHAATRHPSIAGTILSSPLVATPAWLADAQALVATLPPEARAAIARCDANPADTASCEAGNAAFVANFYLRRPRPPELTAYRDTLPRTFTPPLYEAMWGPTEFRCTGTLRDYDGAPLLAKLDGARTLFMTGEHDEARPSTVRAFAARARGAFVEIAGAGHSTLNDNTPAWLATVAGFLASRDA